ncbi:MAG: hypothetical protein JWM43_511 [Acidobacteriaceae bacterium]|nr:hypothetical protein [Acidobacteriaceae bacterium]
MTYKDPGKQDSDQPLVSEPIRSHLRRRILTAPWLAVALCLLTGEALLWSHAQIAVRNQGYVPFSEAPINYRSEDLSDPVAKLQQRLDASKAKLVYEPEHGYLKSVLKELEIPLDSQTLVFSKTSFQYKKISPDHPRALYFNDDVYIGSVHEGKAIEVVSFDPMQGAIFYLLDEHQVEKPKFERAELDCTQCHIAAGTRGVPGVLLRSVYPTATGTQASSSKSFITDQESAIKNRWGGWYVTGKGTAAPELSMGNAVVRDGGTEPSSDVKLTPIASEFDATKYLSNESDVVAHLVLAHQTQAHNLITLTNYRARIAAFQAARANDDKTVTPTLSDKDRLLYEKPAEQLLRYMVFANEAPLTGLGFDADAKSNFARTFASQGPRDSKGRSLRDFDLKTHTFRYPCSYLIYTESFDSIPEPAKSYLYHRLLQVLTSEDQGADFAGISPESRRAALEILLATKRGLPEEWLRYAKTNRLHIAAQPTRASHIHG